MALDPKSAPLAELRQYARDELGMNLSEQMAEEDVRETVARGLGLEAAMGRGKRSPKSAPKPAAQADRVRIVIHKTGERGGDRDVPVAVNGRAYLIKRGVEAEVPAEVVEVLRNAVEERFEWVEDPTSPQRGYLKSRQAQAYPFSVLA